MNVGESIKYYRTQAGLTQKDLADKLNVSFQTISKWENNTNEPDLSTLKTMCGIFNCSMDDITNYEAKIEDNSTNDETQEIIETPQETQIQIGTCADCGWPIYANDLVHHVEKISPGNIKETVTVCENCFQKRVRDKQNKFKQDAENKKKEIKQKKEADFRKVVTWGIVVAILGFIISLTYCILNVKTVGIGWTIASPLLISYALFADIYCIFTYTWIGEVFVSIASWSVKFPGILFSFDLGGLAFLIVMKLLFWFLGLLIGIGVFLLALSITSFLSVFVFPFQIAKDRR